MSELISAKNSEQDFYRQLLASVSGIALFSAIYGIGAAQAADPERPTVWIELGAQSEQVSGFGDPYNPPFTSEIIADGFKSPLELQRALSQSVGGEGKILFRPESSSWVFSAAVQYGRANGRKAVHEQTPARFHASVPTSSGIHTFYETPVHGTERFSETHVSNDETHAVLDFQAGRDVGLGLFSGGQSLVSLGVRVAQFTSNQSLTLIADPDFYFPLHSVAKPKYHHSYVVASHMERSFRGLGPSLSWNASMPVIGSPDDGGITLDWGMNAAVLFGRQKALGHHQTTAVFYKSNEFQKYHRTTHFQRSGSVNRARSAIVPNLGGFAGASFRFSNAKVSFGYRADFFFGAIDSGIDTRELETLGFHGPFATISIGLGG